MLICLHGRASGLDFGKNSIYFREEHKGRANNRPADGGASRRDRGQSNSRSVRLLASKPRYEILDGLRGVAALIIVAFHLFETYSHGPATQILNHGYLAVDFFFALSGFVIGIYCLAIFNAYAAWKLYDMPVRQWLRRKLFAPVSK